MSAKPAFVIYGHHKCATMSLNTMASAVSRRLGLRFRAVFDEQQFNRDLADFSIRENIDFLSFGNADYQYSSKLPAHRGAHIIRDPRDIVVSAYFSHMYSHETAAWKELRAHREKLKALPKEDGLLAEIEFRAKSFGHMAGWNYDQAHILEFRFEDLVANPYDTLLSVYRHLGLLDEGDYRINKRVAGLYREICAALYAKASISWPARLGSRTIPAAEFLTIAWRNRFQARASGRKTGIENTRSHYRKGQAGDWQNHFTDTHKRSFKKLYPDLVPRLGYSDDDDW